MDKNTLQNLLEKIEQSKSIRELDNALSVGIRLMGFSSFSRSGVGDLILKPNYSRDCVVLGNKTLSLKFDSFLSKIRWWLLGDNASLTLLSLFWSQRSYDIEVLED